jgi:hypothetical protein
MVNGVVRGRVWGIEFRVKCLGLSVLGFQFRV